MSKKQTIKQIQIKVWNECKRIIKLRYGNDCYTCGAKDLQGSNRHTGHLVPKKYLPYQFKYEIKYLRPQCYNCNMNLGGMGAMYLKRLLKETNKPKEIYKFLSDVQEQKKLQRENKPKPKEVYSFYENLLEELKAIKK